MNDKIEDIINYISGIVNIGDRCNETIKECINLIHQSVPVDNSGVFSRLSRCNAVSDDLVYIIMNVKKRRNIVESELKKNKDPKFTILVRSGRPSTQAIESEIRVTTPIVSELENKLSEFDNILEYLNHLEKCLDRLIYIMRDLAQYIKK